MSFVRASFRWTRMLNIRKTTYTPIVKKLFSTVANQETIFDKILKKQIPSTAVYEDELVYVFKDISPAAPVHLLIIPKNKDGLTGISKSEERHVSVLGHMLTVVAKLGKQLDLKDGYRLVINEGKHGCQTVDHLHIHFLAGKQFTWPPGTGGNSIDKFKL